MKTGQYPDRPPTRLRKRHLGDFFGSVANRASPVRQSQIGQCIGSRGEHPATRFRNG